MSEETFSIELGNLADDWLTSPTGRNLSLLCEKSTTLFTDESVKDIFISEKNVLLRITTQKSGYTLQKVYGHPNTSTSLNKALEPQPAVVVPTYHAKLILFDSAKGERDSIQQNINVTRDAWYYLGADDRGLKWCRNIAFEPLDPANNKYLTDQRHFPSAADPNVHGYFLMQDDSQRGQNKRYLHAEKVRIHNLYGAPLSTRTDELLASNVMFHIGGFYMARARALHAKWLGGSEGCFAFIPKESMREKAEDAEKITMKTAFFSNRTWVNLTTIIERYRDSDPKKRFFVEVEKREPYPRDEVKNILMIAGANDGFIDKINSGADAAARMP